MAYNTTIWNTKLINEVLQKLRYGAPVDMSCFHERDIELRAGNVLFQLTQEEEDEFIKCSADINYFVTKYCRFLTDKGRTTVNLRYYQKDILNDLSEEVFIPDLNEFGPKNRNTIIMMSRQMGKCQNIDTQIVTNKGRMIMSILYYKSKQKLTLLEKIKVFLINKYLIKFKIIKNIILSLIQLIESLEYKNLKLDENDISKKILDEIPLYNIEIDTPQGYKTATHIYKTQPYHIWAIELEDNLKLECADNHIVIDSLGNNIFVKDLKIGYYIQTRFGLKKVIKLSKSKFKVSMYDISVDSIEHLYYSNDIVSHNTTTIAAYFAWYLCFHTDRNLSILANKQTTAIEIVSKVMDVFRGLPFFLKPGVLNAGSMGMRLDNGCLLTSQATTKTAQIGFAIHVLYIDEFAHIASNIARSFWRSVYPTLSSSLISQCIITSTPNGQDNLFFELWDKAIRGLNSFMHKRVDYWECPGHDDEWAKKMKADFGEEEFAQEFELKFDIASNTLLSASHLAYMKRIAEKYIYNELSKSKLDDSLYRNLTFYKDFDPDSDFTNDDAFVLSIDLGEGKDEDEKKDNDYNICNIFKLEPKSVAQLSKLRNDQIKIENMFRLRQVGLYRDNIKDEENCALVTKTLLYDQLGADRCLLHVEMNFQGKNFINKIIDHEQFYDNIIVHTYHTKPIPGEKPPRKKMGFKVTTDKDHFCKQGKKLIGDKTIIITNKDTSEEFSAFGKNKKGKYKGIGKHDDTVMSTLNLSRLFEEEQYKDFLYDLLEKLSDSPSKRLINKLLETDHIESTDISDSEFNALYGTDNNLDYSNVNSLFEQGSKKMKTYNQGFTLSRH